jgi:hypothetical protein
LRKVNAGDNVVPKILQVRMFLYGLIPMLTPLVATENPTSLEEAVERAKVVETGYNYVPTKQVSFNTTTATRNNPTIKDIVSDKATGSSTTSDVDALTNQLQQLTLSYANLSSALLAQPNTKKPERRNTITCYKCGKEGHIARECRSGGNNNTSRGSYRNNNNMTRSYRPRRDDRNTRRVNYLNEYDNYYYSSEDEYEVYEIGATRAKKYNSESNKERTIRKRVRTGDEMDENEDYTVRYIPETPETSASEAERSSSKSKGKKTRKFRMKPAAIESVTEFDIAQYIKDLPCGLSIGQASANIPKYRSAMLKSIRRKREANYLGHEAGNPTTAARCEFHINGEPVSAVIDSGAATSIMTKKLMKKLGYSINSSSNLVIVTANGTKVRSLEKSQNYP